MNTSKMVLLISLLTILTTSGCHNDPAPAKPRVDKLRFAESEKTINIGEVVQVGIEIEPRNAKPYTTIEYAVTSQGIIDIKEESGNDAVVFEGLQRGSAVITAKADGVVDYCSVTVTGANNNVIPHILLPSYVLELRENEQRIITASLAGGTPLDDNGFIWTHTNSRTIQLETAGKTAVIDTLGIGESVITVSHPKAAYTVDMLVFVVGNNETPVYISTDRNVISAARNDAEQQFRVELVGGRSDDVRSFVYEVIEGANVIEVTGNNEIGAIRIKDKGVAKIGVSHIKAPHRLEIVVLVYDETEYRHIDTSQTFLVLNKGEEGFINLSMVGNVSPDYLDKFSVTLDIHGSIDVRRTTDMLYITALQAGKTVITVNNEYSDFSKKILIIVNDDITIIDNAIYITTDQNVIMMEAGPQETVLTMMLVGGIEADRNNFTWTVDDSTIINVESADGKVEYADLRNRASAGNVNSKFETQAIIKAKKVGTATITLENPKSKNTSTVIVKVYKSGTFGIVPVVIKGNPYYKVEHNGQYNIRLSIATGKAENAHNTVWTIADPAIASVEGAGLSGIVQGLKKGVTALTVSGPNLSHDYTSVIIVGDETYFGEKPFIYVHNPYTQVIRDQSIMFRVMCENMTIEDIGAIRVINNSPDIVNVFAYRNNVNVTGLATGIGELMIEGNGTNTLRVLINVEDYAINPDQPYYLRSGNSIQGIVKGQNIEIAVDLVGSNIVNQRDTVWRIENSGIATINGNGTRCLVQGIAIGQTAITVSHPKSVNDLVLVIYVADNEASLYDSVVLYMSETNILLQYGEERYITLITNANAAQRNTISWNVSDAAIVELTVSNDRIKALIRGSGIGATNINVTSSFQVLPVNIFVSVVMQQYNGKYVNVPSIIEGVVGDIKTIKAVYENIYDPWNISWTIADSHMALIQPNNGICMVNMTHAGNTRIRVEYGEIGFVKDIVIVVYNSLEELVNSYVMGCDQTRYIINKGDIINVGLVFGIKGFPVHELGNIRWQAGSNNVVQVTGNGKQGIITGAYAGVGLVTVSSSIAQNSVTIEVEVRDYGNMGGKYYFGIAETDRIKGLVIGSSINIDIKAYTGSNALIENLSGIEYIVENPNIIHLVDNGGVIRVTARNEGQSYITVRHELVEETRILIYAAVSNAELQKIYPIMADSTNYLLQIGESANIVMRTIDNDVNKLNNIRYELERNNGAISIQEKEKRHIMVQGIRGGSDVIIVRYNNAVVQRIYVSVMEFNYDASGGYLITEHIVAMVVGQEITTSVKTSNPGYVSWSSEDTSVVGISNIDYAHDRATLWGKSVGSAYVIVRAGIIERHLLAVVCANEDELLAFRAINVEQRYHQIRKGDNATINVVSNTGIVEGTTVYSNFYNNGTTFDNVIDITSSDNAKLSIHGLNEGIAAIRIKNNAYDTEIVVYVEVYSRKDGILGSQGTTNYITAVQTLYVIDLNETNIGVNAGMVNNEYIPGNWIWRNWDESIISVQSNGAYAVVNPKRKGETDIEVLHTGCANILKITVIVGDRYNITYNSFPYIYVERDLIDVNINAKEIIIDYSLQNVGQVNYGNVQLINRTSDTISVAKYLDGQIRVVFNKSGIGRFTIVYGELSHDIYVLIREELTINNIYLTTSENVVIATVNEVKTVNIRLMGYDEVNSGNFEWKSNNAGILRVVGNGPVGQIYGLAMGNTVVTVSHPAANYDLTIIVKVVANTALEKAVYLTTQRNVIENVIGDTANYIYVQKIGGNSLKIDTVWSVDDSSILDLTGSRLSASYIVKKAGVARITVTLVEEGNNYPLSIIIIARQKTSDDYIYMDNSLIVLKPGEYQYVNVALASGEEKDYGKFTWVNLQEIGLNGLSVAGILASGAACRIDAINPGICKIGVSHPNTDFLYTITVYVTDHEVISFSVKDTVLVEGYSSYIPIKIPNYQDFRNNVVLVSNNESVCEVVHTSTTALLIGKSVGTAVIGANIDGVPDQNTELFVSVVAEEGFERNKITVSSTLYNMTAKSPPQRIMASVAGLDVQDKDNDGIVWELTSLTPGISANALVSVFPSNRQGREIQITPIGKTGQLIINVRHNREGFVEEQYCKNILVVINDDNQRFTLDQQKISIEGGQPVTLKANILGGTTKDYEDISWLTQRQAKWDGSYVEVVRLYGSGREVSLYPLRDGVVKIIAMYGSQFAECEVTVISDYYFDFNIGNITMYPGQPDREISFDIRPSTANIRWLDIDNVNKNGDQIVRYGEFNGSATETSKSGRYLTIKALAEGTAIIVGMANGNVGYLNIFVKINYEFEMDYTYAKYIPKGGNTENGSTSDGKARINFTVKPPNTSIEITNSSNTTGLDYEIQHNFETGSGVVIFSSDLELRRTITFDHLKYRPSESTQKEKTGISLQRQIIYAYKETTSPYAYFVRTRGSWSNRERSDTQYRAIKGNAVLGEQIRELSSPRERELGGTISYELTIGDGETHYIMFDKHNENAHLIIGDPETIDQNGSAKGITPQNMNVDGWNTLSNGVRWRVDDITHNNKTQRAFIISGGEDYIEYDRAAFSKELIFNVESATKTKRTVANPLYSRVYYFETNQSYTPGAFPLSPENMHEMDYYGKYGNVGKLYIYNYCYYPFFKSVLDRASITYSSRNTYDYNSILNTMFPFMNQGVAISYDLVSGDNKFKTYDRLFGYDPVKLKENGYGNIDPAYDTPFTPNKDFKEYDVTWPFPEAKEHQGGSMETSYYADSIGQPLIKPNPYAKGVIYSKDEYFYKENYFELELLAPQNSEYNVFKSGYRENSHKNMTNLLAEGQRGSTKYDWELVEEGPRSVIIKSDHLEKDTYFLRYNNPPDTSNKVVNTRNNHYSGTFVEWDYHLVESGTELMVPIVGTGNKYFTRAFVGKHVREQQSGNEEVSEYVFVNRYPNYGKPNLPETVKEGLHILHNHPLYFAGIMALKQESNNIFKALGQAMGILENTENNHVSYTEDGFLVNNSYKFDNITATDGDRVIVPTTIMNYYPFRYPEDITDLQKGLVDVITFKGDANNPSKPMPSIDTSPTQTSSFSITLKYEYMKDGDIVRPDLKFTVNYERRKSHFAFTDFIKDSGSSTEYTTATNYPNATRKSLTGKNAVTQSAIARGYIEVEGPITRWDDDRLEQKRLPNGTALEFVYVDSMWNR
jgi:hypothetical protein